MKRVRLKWVFLTGLVVLFVWIKRPVSTPQRAPAVPTVTALPVELMADKTAKPELSIPVHQGELSYGRSDSSIERLMAKVDPATLERMQNDPGSTSNGYGVRVKSSWIPVLTNLPSTSFKMRYNPNTDTYEFRGADVGFSMGLGAGYEQDPESGESRGYLQFHKSF